MHIVGFDLGKRKSQLCIQTTDGKVLELRVATERGALGLALGKLGGRCRILIEASTSSEWVARFLEELGHEVIVADPNFSPMYARSDKKIKTDKRDARALMEALKLGAYRFAVRRDDDNIHLAACLSVRDGLVRARTAQINRLKAIVERAGFRINGKGAAYIVQSTRKLELPPRLAASVEPILVAIGTCTAQIKEAEKPLKAAVSANPALQHMDEVVGIGTITTVAFATTLYNPTRFADASQVSAYLGLVPREHSSGEKRSQGGITKVGNRVTRGLLIEAAWCILRSDNEAVADLRQWALAIQARRGKQRAAVALARRLSRILFAMWRDNTPFKPHHRSAAAVAA